MKSFIKFMAMNLLGIMTVGSLVLSDAETKANSTQCPKDYFHCGNTNECIRSLWRCDGENDCNDGSDEVECDKTTCQAHEFRCSHGHCVPASWRCDGSEDCNDGTDERDCTNCDEFSCQSGECLTWSKVCDGHRDCTDFSDEGHRCSSSCLINNGNCSQICHKFPSGPRCSCHNGFRLGPDGKLCQDIDECKEPGNRQCSHYCNNTEGGFNCSCAPGYFLDHDHRMCKGEGGNAMLIYLLPNQIRGIYLSSPSQTRTFYSAEQSDMRGMDYDASEGIFFWTEWKESVIGYYTLDTNRSDLLLKTPQKPYHLKWDWVAKNVYYTDSDGSIRACSRDGKYCTIVVTTPAPNINSLEIDPISGLLFWSVWSSVIRSNYGIIERAEMDGSKRNIIISDNIHWPSALNVDHVLQYIYWTDAKRNTIECADFNGLNRREIVQGIPYYPFSMALFEDDVFWTDWGTDSIMKCDRFSGQPCSTLHKGNVKAEVLVVAHQALQPKGVNWCQNSTCSHICLLTRTGYSCKCDIYNKDDNSSCSHDTVASSSLKPEVEAPKPEVEAPKPEDEEHKPEVEVPCPDDYCMRSVTCVMTGEQIVCQCPLEYDGDRCEKYVGYDYNWIIVTAFGLFVPGVVVVVLQRMRKNRKRLRNHHGGNSVVSFRDTHLTNERDKAVVDIDNCCDHLLHIGDKKPEFGSSVSNKTQHMVYVAESKNSACVL